MLKLCGGYTVQNPNLILCAYKTLIKVGYMGGDVKENIFFTGGVHSFAAI